MGDNPHQLGYIEHKVIGNVIDNPRSNPERGWL